MSGFGGFGGGFGQSNNTQQQTSGFGGFGASNTNTNTGFGTTTGTGFGGTNTTGGGLFGNSGGSTGFGGSGGFGGTGTSGFGGAKPSGFGSTTTTSGGSLFGGNTATAGSGFGGFGSSTTPAATSGFGSTNTGGGLFGQQQTKSAFGGAASNPFGGASSGTGFGTSFTAPPSTALGGNVGECQGTASVAFQPHVEKEPNTSSNQQNSFQSVVFQAPYVKFSPEELRLADYTQGRRYGNQSNQAGAFGANTNFGGSFGSGTQPAATGFGTGTTGGGLFGGGAASGFGSTTQPQNTGFGSNTATTGLFGAPKPAAAPLFGAQQPAQSTGLFGGGGTGGFGSTTATGGFGSNTASNTSSLFGTGNANAAAPKPAFSFGNAATQPSTNTGFGAAPASSGFGGGGLFGQPQQNTGTFGQPQQQAAANNPFGGGGGFGSTAQPAATNTLFGQPKPAGPSLFGPQTSAPAPSLFGNPPANNTNPFGTSTNNATQSNLFGTKPATTNTSIFGGAQNTQTNAPGSLFGGGGFGTSNQTQPQQNAGGAFGLGTNTQTKSLFGGATQQQPMGNSIFNTGTQQQGNSLFGATNQQQQQQPQSSFGVNSLFNPQNSQNQQGPTSFTTSISDPAAFGQSMFAPLAGTQVTNPGPLATPLLSAKAKKVAAVPIYKLSTTPSSRFSTPTKRGYGFSYSTYGTPGSASSTASTPGASLSASFFGNSISRGLSKSISTSSLRRSFTTEDSILAPGAFSASPAARQYGSTGSMKKLVINRTLRGDLFSPPPQQSQQSQQTPATPTGGILKKRVSFDHNTMGATNGTANLFTASSPLKQVQGSATPSSEDLGFMRPQTRNGSKLNGATAASPEMTEVRGNELAIVPEEEATAPAPAKSLQPVDLEDQEPGQYWSKPSKEELDKMPRAQLERFRDFTVGRQGVGHVTFNSEVNLTKVPLDELFGKIVELQVRSCTVYGDPARKPPVGQGLNVPSTIHLRNSWPRGGKGRAGAADKLGHRLKKHIERLRRVPETHYKGYEEDTGTWIFTVDHYTTYKLDDDDDETDGEGMSEFDQSTLSAPPDSPTPAPRLRTPKANHYDDSFASTSQLTHTESDPEDTFQFRKKRALPGSFDNEELFEDDEGMEDASFEQQEQSFLDKRSVGSQSEEDVEVSMDHDDLYDDESVSIVDQEMAGSFPQADYTTEQDGDSQDDEGMDFLEDTPGGIMRARLRALKDSGTPQKKFTAGNDWAAALQRTISPKKQDRALLKSLIDIHGNDSRPELTVAPRNRVVSDGRGFATSIDLMNSLFGQAKSPTKVAKIPAQSKGFEWPYAKRPKTADNDTSKMDNIERAFHDSMKPSWGPDGTLVYAVSSGGRPFSRSSRQAHERNGLLTIQKGGVVSESRDVRFARFSNEASADALKSHKEMTIIDNSGEVPFATLPDEFSFSDFFYDNNAKNPAATHEKLVWQLASILFDHVVVSDELRDVPNIIDRLRKDKLSMFWQQLVDNASSQHIVMAKSSEEKAIGSLSGHKVADACAHLLNGKNFHLATLVAQIGGRESLRKDIREQLSEWQKSQVLPEFSKPIRALYEILGGNVCVCSGAKGGPIEDRIDPFVISKQFGFDWRQAFGLRLWYGILAGEDIKVAVERFQQDLEQDLETSRPQAWYVEQRVLTLWDDKELDSRQDLLWGLLLLYSFPDTDLQAIIRPENSQLSPLDLRLSWQLSRALTAIGGISYGEDANDKADQVTVSFASQLTNEGSWLDAIFVLLHISSSDARAKSIQNHLAHHAGQIGMEDSQSFMTLTRTFKIPAAWIWEAKALYMRSVQKDSRGEVDCLIKAGSFQEAHQTFARDVAPQTIIERDYATLRTLLHGFSGQEDYISEWHLGGQIYEDFLALLEFQKKGMALEYPVLDRLLAGLPAVLEEVRNPGFMQTVAIETISAVVAKAVVDMNGEKSDLPKILKLPLTEDNYLKHTVELSLTYYRDVMTSGR